MCVVICWIDTPVTHKANEYTKSGVNNNRMQTMAILANVNEYECNIFYMYITEYNNASAHKIFPIQCISL